MVVVKHIFNRPRTPTISGETLSDARMASEGPGATIKKRLPPPHRRARACPSPALALGKKRLWFSSGTRGTGPRATIKTPSLNVGRGPVPRHATIAGDRPPRYGGGTHPFFIVGRGSVPRHRSRTRNPTLAGDRPPRYDKKRLPLNVGRGPVPRQCSR